MRRLLCWLLGHDGRWVTHVVALKPHYVCIRCGKTAAAP